jgi:hypothetical protein
VTPEQLNVASGMVRCGACLDVFSADRNMVDYTVEDLPAPAASAGSMPTHDPDEGPIDEARAPEGAAEDQAETRPETQVEIGPDRIEGAEARQAESLDAADAVDSPSVDTGENHLPSFYLPSFYLPSFYLPNFEPPNVRTSTDAGTGGGSQEENAGEPAPVDGRRHGSVESGPGMVSSPRDERDEEASGPVWSVSMTSSAPDPQGPHDEQERSEEPRVPAIEAEESGESGRDQPIVSACEDVPGAAVEAELDDPAGILPDASVENVEALSRNGESRNVEFRNLASRDSEIGAEYSLIEESWPGLERSPVPVIGTSAQDLQERNGAHDDGTQVEDNENEPRLAGASEEDEQGEPAREPGEQPEGDADESTVWGRLPLDPESAPPGAQLSGFEVVDDTSAASEPPSDGPQQSITPPPVTSFDASTDTEADEWDTDDAAVNADVWATREATDEEDLAGESAVEAGITEGEGTAEAGALYTGIDLEEDAEPQVVEADERRGADIQDAALMASDEPAEAVREMAADVGGGAVDDAPGESAEEGPEEVREEGPKDSPEEGTDEVVALASAESNQQPPAWCVPEVADDGTAEEDDEADYPPADVNSAGPDVRVEHYTPSTWQAVDSSVAGDVADFPRDAVPIAGGQDQSSEFWQEVVEGGSDPPVVAGRTDHPLGPVEREGSEVVGGAVRPRGDAGPGLREDAPRASDIESRGASVGVDDPACRSGLLADVAPENDVPAPTADLESVREDSDLDDAEADRGLDEREVASRPGVLTTADLARIRLPDLESDTLIDMQAAGVDLDALGLLEIDAVEVVDLGTGSTPGAGPRVVWSLLSVLLAFALGLQYAWFNMDRLAQVPEYRVWYKQACKRLDCDLPDYVNVSEVETVRLVVRSHTTVDRALAVDAILFNAASFRQPFPALQLTFSDLSGELIADRRFAPEDYLAGELTGLRYIPALTEVRLSLEIVDPGERAMNYTLSPVH